MALKVLLPTVATDPDRLKRLAREAHTLASLNHPNIAQVYDLEEIDGARAVIMELVEGRTLADRISSGPIPIHEALAIARQIAAALEASHAQNIIHRDLKPSNVSLRADGTVKVLDFGLSKALDDHDRTDTVPGTAAGADVTATGIVLGTAAYMSPEQGHGWWVVPTTGTGERLLMTSGDAGDDGGDWSPDGGSVVLSKGGRLYRTMTGGGEPVLLPTIERPFSPRFSHDAQPFITPSSPARPSATECGNCRSPTGRAHG